MQREYSIYNNRIVFSIELSLVLFEVYSKVMPNFIENYYYIYEISQGWPLILNMLSLNSEQLLIFFFAGTKRVGANVVYQEYISDREHLHMNSTQWETLTEFVKWLGKEGVSLGINVKSQYIQIL